MGHLWPFERGAFRGAITALGGDIEQIGVDDVLSEEEFSTIQTSLQDLREEHIASFPDALDASSSLQEYWGQDLHPELYYERRLRDAVQFDLVRVSGKDADDFHREKASKAQAVEPVETKWFVGMSNGFIKSVTRIDRKLQGRILEAINAIIRDPMTPKGDTIRPLRDGLTGLWRFHVNRDSAQFY